jgi:hypothetical protein
VPRNREGKRDDQQLGVGMGLASARRFIAEVLCRCPFPGGASVVLPDDRVILAVALDRHLHALVGKPFCPLATRS